MSMQKVRLAPCISLIIFIIFWADIFCASRKQQPLQSFQCYYCNILTYAYSIRSLHQSLCFFSALSQCDYCYIPCGCTDQNNCITIDSARFFHQEIRNCIDAMKRTQSLKPVVSLLEKNKRNYYHDHTFIRELFLLMFTIHKQILFEEIKTTHITVNKKTIDTLMHAGERINQLPLAEILDAIDILVNELPLFLEKYEFNSKMPWKSWLRKYWWVPPVIGGWLILRILLSFQRRQFYYSSYSFYSPRPYGPMSPIITNDPALLEIRDIKNK